jgi:aminoglycoside phosphotransferase family enzyme
MLARMTAAPALEAKVAFLRGLCGPGDEAIETHFSWIFLAGDLAWKLRKPVARDTMDYRSVEARRVDAHEEVRLNRRLAVDIYLRAVPLSCAVGGGLSIDGPGEIVDWLVCMRRLDRTRLLDVQLSLESFNERALEPIARLLARFYREAEPAISDGTAFVSRLLKQAAANHAVLAPAGRPGADTLLARQAEFVDAHRAIVEGRAAAGCVVEAHGDLRPEHVFVGDPPAVIDCLEFDRDLRILDRAEELAFLELECARLGHARAGHELACRTLALLDDSAPDNLRSFYRSHRAATRAKLYVWRAGEPDGGDSSSWLGRADGYISSALAESALSPA